MSLAEGPSGIASPSIDIPVYRPKADALDTAEKNAPSVTKPLRRPFEAVASSGSIDILHSPLRVPRSEAFRKDFYMKTDDDTEDEEMMPDLHKMKKRPLAVGSPRRPSHTSSLNAYGIPLSQAAVQKANSKPDLNDRIRVCLRKRPLSKKEIAKRETDVAIVTGRRTIHFYEPKYAILDSPFLKSQS